jgi:hypothetical protein
MEDLLSEKKLRMKIYYELSPSIKMLEEKVLISQEVKILICGGNVVNKNVREDYIVERVKGRLKLKTIKLTGKESSVL